MTCSLDTMESMHCTDSDVRVETLNRIRAGWTRSAMPGFSMIKLRQLPDDEQSTEVRLCGASENLSVAEVSGLPMMSARRLTSSDFSPAETDSSALARRGEGGAKLGSPLAQGVLLSHFFL